MLVLSRKAAESILIGDNIEVVVVRIDGNRVRLGIQAPQHVRVVRNELQGNVVKPMGTTSQSQIHLSDNPLDRDCMDG
ncbi:MAG: carbon storage regulator CsrA [Planctomycetes bacterium]|nr:carbon storage regulator CsrA [Planctomycetota bacterium]MBL7043465.1 carbon storage regulator CsrA [Pirellulaceae bacterium]